MNQTTASPGLAQTRATRLIRYALPAALLLALVAVLFAYRAWNTRPPASTPAASQVISAAELEERYGLRVRLIGVTAGGGMIDFRLKILDAEKARGFLQDPANLPRLIAAEKGTTLVAPAEGIDEDMPWEEGGILFFLVPNSGGAIQPGTPVSVVFGEVQLEPVIAQ